MACTLFRLFGPPYDSYEGPLPKYYIDIGIRNVGAIAADQVTGWIYLDKEILEPVDYFAEEDVEYAGEQHGKVKVRLTVQRPEGQLFASYQILMFSRSPFWCIGPKTHLLSTCLRVHRVSQLLRSSTCGCLR